MLSKRLAQFFLIIMVAAFLYKYHGKNPESHKPVMDVVKLGDMNE